MRSHPALIIAGLLLSSCVTGTPAGTIGIAPIIAPTANNRSARETYASPASSRHHPADIACACNDGHQVNAASARPRKPVSPTVTVRSKQPSKQKGNVAYNNVARKYYDAETSSASSVYSSSECEGNTMLDYGECADDDDDDTLQHASSEYDC
ncbi:hypothetical protein SYNPS1DRAFT_27916 [Syncephalis pseudoplumigaleata]|uniref:Secreted protein n=1 Tax=Syncephalis pseudoplumigaleata TaxID=1712513 RepID=A0A4P9Z223_9FUNG|nr:hypothetical protein SYNPS1DRAFT_27916 [Syncephalis pseudoplumigaleata]|eukprot:RKP26388.1 hypothetical protein SYNPS1DRAFT_27916 [Syncephalis pseudoplumigaleata]